MKESLKNNLKKKKGKIVNLISKFLLIRHKPTKLEYTVSKIIFEEEPAIIAYRYHSGKDNKEKVYITIKKKDFKDYEPV